MSEAPDEQTQEQDGPEPDETPTPIQPPDEDADAEEAESEEVEGQEGEPSELQPDAEQGEGAGEPEALSQKEIESRLDKLNREGERHAKRVHEIMAEAMRDLTPCELCWPFAPGFRFEPIPDDQRAAVMLTLGVSEVANYAEDTHSQACADCRGWGVVATGSKVQGQEALTCMNCNGRGWMGDRATGPVAAPPLSPMSEPANGAPEVVPHTPEVAEAIRIAKAAGAIVIEPTIPAAS